MCTSPATLPGWNSPWRYRGEAAADQRPPSPTAAGTRRSVFAGLFLRQRFSGFGRTPAFVGLAEPRIRRQLQDGRALTLAEPCHENHPAVGKLQRVMVHVRLAGINSSKPGKSLALHTKPEARQQAGEGVGRLDLAVENEFGAREKADCYSRLGHRREAAGFGSGETGRN